MSDPARAALAAALRAGRASHAYLLHGPDPAALAALARAAAKALLCPDGASTGEACGACAVCARADHGNHPDVVLLGVPEDKREIPIDAVRERIAFLALAPLEAKGKVLILEEADRLTEPAENALLKTLEEPPPGATLILWTVNPAAVMPTTRSRCQPVHAPAEPAAPPGSRPAAGDAKARAERLGAALVAPGPRGAAARVAPIGAEIPLDPTQSKRPLEAIRQDLLPVFDEALRGARDRALEAALAGRPTSAWERVAARLLDATGALFANATPALVVAALAADIEREIGAPPASAARGPRDEASARSRRRPSPPR